MRTITKSKNMSIYKHLSILVAWVLIIASSLGIRYLPSVEAGDLPGPHNIYGYIDNSTDQDIPSGVTVTLTNLNSSESGTTTTGAQGSYIANVGKDGIFHSDDGDWIVVNCSYNSEVGENLTTIDTGIASYSWCNLSGGTRLEPKNTSFSINDTDWNVGSLDYNDSSTTGNTSFNLTNEGNVNINIKIHGENITWNGDQWNLTNTTAPNNYSIKYQKNGDVGSSWTNITLNNRSFVTDLEYNSSYFGYTYWQLFGLNFTLPWDNSDKPSSSVSFNVTFWSIEA